MRLVSCRLTPRYLGFGASAKPDVVQYLRLCYSFRFGVYQATYVLNYCSIQLAAVRRLRCRLAYSHLFFHSRTRLWTIPSFKSYNISFFTLSLSSGKTYFYFLKVSVIKVSFICGCARRFVEKGWRRVCGDVAVFRQLLT